MWKKQGLSPCFFYLNEKISDSIINFTTTNKKAEQIVVAMIFLNIAGLHHYPYSIFLYYLGKFMLFNSLNEKKS